MAALAPTVNHAERRRHRRMQTSLIATVNYGRLMLPCFVADVSSGGAKIKLIDPAKLQPGQAVLECSRLGKIAAEVVWQKGLFAGLRFAKPQDLGELARPAPAAAPTPPSA